MDKKTLGFILMGAGVIVFALSYPLIRAALKLPVLPSMIKDIYIVVAAVALLAAGAFITFKLGGSEQAKEVPIYHGEKVVGFRRLEK
jgi:hypothetical protein